MALAEFSRLRTWLPQLGLYASFQASAQLVTVLAGFVVIRQLSRQDYGYYALVTSLIGAMAGATEVGLSSSVFSLGGPAHDDSRRLSQIFSSALRFRRLMGAIVGLLATPLIFILLTRSGVTTPLALGYALVGVATFSALLRGSLFALSLRFLYKFRLPQYVPLRSALLRLCGVCILVWLFRLGLTSIFVLGLAVALTELFSYRRAAHKALDWHAPSHAPDWKVFLGTQRRILPVDLVWVFQGQVLFFILASTDRPETIAVVAALSRFSVVFALLGYVVDGVVTPVFARTPSERLRMTLTDILLLYSAVSVIMVAACALVPNQLLQLLGHKYGGLATQLVIVMIGSAIAALGNTLSSLNQARGWLRGMWIYIPISIVWLTGLVLAIDVRTLTGAAIFAAATAIPGCLVQSLLLLNGLRRTQIRSGE